MLSAAIILSTVFALATSAALCDGSKSSPVRCVPDGWQWLQKIVLPPWPRWRTYERGDGFASRENSPKADLEEVWTGDTGGEMRQPGSPGRQRPWRVHLGCSRPAP